MRNLIAAMKVSLDVKTQGPEGIADWVEAWSEDFDLTPQSRVTANVNHLWFDKTEVLEALRAAAPIDKDIGTDLSIAYIWRPFSTQNIVLRVSGAMLLPGEGIKNLYGTDDNTYYTVLTNLIVTY